MAARNREAAILRVLAHEGGYTNHPSDPGGPTNWGITIYDARAYWKAAATAADVKAMPREVALAIYKAKYWDALRCDDMPAGLDYCLFDYGVNSGIARAARVINRVTGAAGASSKVTDATLARIALRDAEALINSVCNERTAFLKSLKTWPVFGKGWGRRVTEVRAAALRLSRNDLRPVATEVAAARATPQKPAILETSNASATVAATPAVAAAAASSAGWSGSTALMIAAACVVATALVVGFIAWRHRSRAETPIPEAQIVPMKG